MMQSTESSEIETTKKANINLKGEMMTSCKTAFAICPLQTSPKLVMFKTGPKGTSSKLCKMLPKKTLPMITIAY